MQECLKKGLHFLLIFSIANFLFDFAFTVPVYLKAWGIPTALVPLVPAILMPGCIGLALLVLSFLPPPPVDLEGIPLDYLRFLPPRIVPWDQPREPTKWADLQNYYQKYRYWILFFARANIVYFVSLAGYFIILGEKMSQELNSERAGGFIFLFWTIMNCFIMIIACMSLIFASREDPPESVGRDSKP